MWYDSTRVKFIREIGTVYKIFPLDSNSSSWNILFIYSSDTSLFTYQYIGKKLPLHTQVHISE
jgi:hypothetical protein